MGNLMAAKLPSDSTLHTSHFTLHTSKVIERRGNAEKWRMMTDGELLWRIELARERIQAEGLSFGKIELVVRNGEIKHVNVSYEIGPEAGCRRQDSGAGKMRNEE